MVVSKPVVEGNTYKFMGLHGGATFHVGTRPSGDYGLQYLRLAKMKAWFNASKARWEFTTVPDPVPGTTTTCSYPWSTKWLKIYYKTGDILLNSTQGRRAYLPFGLPASWLPSPPNGWWEEPYTLWQDLNYYYMP